MNLEKFTHKAQEAITKMQRHIQLATISNALWIGTKDEL
jgi:hypothetical protein